MKHRLTFAAIVMFLFVLFIDFASARTPSTKPPEKFLDALHQIESSGKLGAILGDNGRALGPLQIHRSYWEAANIIGTYEQVADLDYAKAVVTAYMFKHCPDAVRTNDFTTMARVHNGGPNGMNKSSTKSYAVKVVEAMSSS